MSLYQINEIQKSISPKFILLGLVSKTVPTRFIEEMKVSQEQSVIVTSFRSGITKIFYNFELFRWNSTQMFIDSGVVKL